MAKGRTEPGPAQAAEAAAGNNGLSAGAPERAIHQDGGLDDLPLRHPAAGKHDVPAGARDASAPLWLTPQGRDLRLDLLRGYFVVAMIIDHVRGASPLYLLTGGNRFYASAAEGFILTSGMVAGLMYQRLIVRSGFRQAMQRVLARAAVLYLLMVALTLLFLPVSEYLRLPWAQGVDMRNPLQLVASILTLHRSYYLVDVIALYAMLVLVSPLAFVLLSHGVTWPVLAASWGLWALYQVFPDRLTLPWPIAGDYLASFAAWQVLFFTGLVLAYRRHRLPRLSSRNMRMLLLVAGLLLAALIVTFYVVDPPTAVSPGAIATGSPIPHEIRLWIQGHIFARVELRPGRLVAETVVFSFLFLFATLFWRHVRRLAGWLLLPLGQHSMYAYTVFVVIAAIVAALIRPLHLVYPGPQWLNALIQIASVLLLWFCVREQVLAPTLRTRGLWYVAPVAIAVAVILGLSLFASRQPVQAAADPGSEQRVPRRFGVPMPPGSRPTRPMPTPEVPAGQQPSTPEQVKAAQARMARYAKNVKGSLQEQWFYSPELDREMPYIIYLPPDYDGADRRYPVLYLLHGRGGSRDEWPAYGFAEVADQAISDGVVQPMIIVFPQGDKGYWANHADDGLRWGEYLDRDVVSHIDNNYRTLTDRQSRAIGGMSMGAWGALYHAWTRQDLYGVVGAHSTALRLPGDATMTFLGTPDEFEKMDPMALARTQPGLENLTIWVDTAEQDPWANRSRDLEKFLVDRGIQHVFQVYPGQHDYAYWHEHAMDYLRFYGSALARQ